MAHYTYTLIIQGVAAESATFVPLAGALTAPVPPGTAIGRVDVLPATWNGVLTVNTPFAMSGRNVVVGPTPLAAGTYQITGDATP